MLTTAELTQLERYVEKYDVQWINGHGTTLSAKPDIARLIADLKLYKAALEESVGPHMWSDQPFTLTPYEEEQMPALATILKGVKG